MKTKINLWIILCFIALTGQAQQSGSNHYKIITGVRVNPVLIYDLEGHVTQKTLLHAELGAIFNQKFYTSAGYTPAVNAFYNFNEYWFLGFQHKVPVSFVLAESYNFNSGKIFVQSGFNLKISKIGNVYAFLFTSVENFEPGLKVGVFIPLNVILKQK